MSDLRFVVLESPYAGDVVGNVEYARACLLDSIGRGEVPFAGHLLYTQVLDDGVPGDREAGIGLHLAWIGRCDGVVVYVDRGISPGMVRGIEYAKGLGVVVKYRSLIRG